MRITIANWSQKKVGGVETYLENVIPALFEKGHQISFWCEGNQPASSPDIILPPNTVCWCADSMGTSVALAKLFDWKPDLIYINGIHSVAVERQISRVAPTVYFVHAYHGACISGAKSFHYPTVQPCSRQFGWSCLLHYYPHRCGGLNPTTMWKNYRCQSQRLDFLGQCNAIVASSMHMVLEYKRYGLSVDHLPHPVVALEDPRLANTPVRTFVPNKQVLNLLFLGRLYADKGGLLLLDAAVQATNLLARPLHLIFAGDGPDRAKWENHAAHVCATTPALEVSFAGHINTDERNRLLARCDLLTVPSLWPEPFGLVGPEAGLAGVPAAAFAVGGISEWLVDGVNGCLAPADPPNATNFAAAIVRCLQDVQTQRNLSDGAYTLACRFTMENHLHTLLGVFQRILS